MEDRLKALENQIRGILQIIQRLSNENLSNRILNLEKKVDETTKAIRQSFQDRDELMILQRDMNKKARTQVAELTESITQFYDEIESFQRQIEKLEEGTDVQSDEEDERGPSMAVEKLQQRVDDILKF